MYENNQNFKIYENTRNSIKKYWNENGKVNILLLGKSGVGKRTLVNSLFHEEYIENGTPVTKNIKQITKEGSFSSIYNCEGIHHSTDDQYIQNIFKEINEFVEERKRSPNINEHIHAAWFCILEDRYESFEIRLINEISKIIPTIIVITKAVRNDKEYDSYIKKIKFDCKNVKDIIKVLAKTITIGKNIVPPSNLEELVSRTNDILPEGIKSAFNEVQNLTFKSNINKGYNLIKINAFISMIVGFIPKPYDAITLLLIEIEMIILISNLFHFRFFDILKYIIIEISEIILWSLTKYLIFIYILKLIPYFTYLINIFCYLITYEFTKRNGISFMKIISTAYNNKKGDFVTIDDLKKVDVGEVKNNINNESKDMINATKMNLKEIKSYIIEDIKNTIKRYLEKIAWQGTELLKEIFSYNKKEKRN